MADFGVMDDGHPDEVILPPARPNEKPPTVSSGPSGDASRPSTTNASGPPRQMQPPAKTSLAQSASNGQPPRQPPQTPNQNKSNNWSGPQNQNRPQPNGRPQQVSQPAAVDGGVQTPPPANGGVEGPAMFFSARSVSRSENAPPGTMAPGSEMVFNPKLESPSIKKTPGIDHSTSKPVGRNCQHVNPVVRGDEPSSSQRSGAGPGRPAPGNVVNPSFNQSRQIGAPGSHSPMANRGQYRSLTIKRPPPAADGAAATRTALNEVTNKGTDAAADAKRQKVG
jgi:DNA repair and recombination protein RAD52